MHIDFDGIGAGFLIQAKHLGRQLLLAHDPARAGDQRFEHRLLTGGQRQQLTTEGEAPGFHVIHQHATGLLPLATQHAAAQQRLDPGFQLRQFERFGEVVIGAQVQAMHAVFHITACGEHQHWQIFSASA